MVKLEIMAGTTIYGAAKMLAEHPSYCYAEFNGTRIECIDPSPNKKAVADAIVDKWQRDRAAEHQAWLNGPEGKAAELKKKQESDRLNQILDTAIHEMDQVIIDVDNHEQILKFLCKCEDPMGSSLSDDNKRRILSQKILTRLKFHGYKANDCTGNQFNGGNRENFARYIIGQVMDCLQSMGSIHQMVHTFTGQWMDKFGSKK
jgi:hypothetical protein